MAEAISSFAPTVLPAEAGAHALNPLSTQLNTADGATQSLDFTSLLNGMFLGDGAVGHTTTPDLLPFALSGEANIFADDSAEQATTLPLTGNTLPFMAGLDPFNSQPFTVTTVSGFNAYADQDGAEAVSFIGDGKTLLASAPQFANTMNPAIAKSQAQLSEFMLPMITGVGEHDLPAGKVGLESQAELLARLQQSNPVNLADTSLNTNLQPGQQLIPGIQAANEFSSVLAASRATAEPLTATPDQPQWNQQIGDRINWMISRGLRQAEIRLNPPELGMLEVRVQVSGDQANVQFVTAHAEVKDALDNAMSRLREMLANEGLNLANVNVSQQGKGENGQSHVMTGKNQSGDNSDESEIPVAVEQVKVRTSNGMIDFYA